MKLIRIRTQGLKVRDVDESFGTHNLVIGENGTSKSTIVLAIHLLCRGSLSSPDKTSALDSAIRLPSTADGVMVLAREDTIAIMGEWLTEDGQTWTVTRSWRRKGGRVKEDIALGGFGQHATTLSERKALVGQTFAPSLDLFFPSDLVSLTPTKLRDRLLRAVAADLGEVGAWVPEGLPSWAEPASEREAPLDWITVAKTRAGERLNDARAESRRLGAVLEDLEDAWGDPKSAEPIKTQLAKLQVEDDAVTRRDIQTSTVLELRHAVEAARKDAMDVETLRAEVAELEAEANEEAAKRQVYSEWLGRVMRLRQAVKDAGNWAISESDAEGLTVSDAKKARDRALATLEATQAEYAKAEGRLSALESPPVECCPDCGVDLTSHYAALREQLEAEAAEADEAVEAAACGLEVADAEWSEAEARAIRREKAAELRAAQAALDAELAQEPEGTDGGGSERRLSEARRRLRTVEISRGRLEDLEVSLEIAEAELEEMPEGRAKVDIDAERAQLQADLEALGEQNARIAQRVEAEENKETADADVETAKAWVSQFAEVHQAMLGKAAGLIEQRFRTASGAPVSVVLEDARGKPTCELRMGGTPVQGLSGGEMLMWLAANVLAFAPSSHAKWRPLILDRFEAVSIGRREAFLRAIVEAESEGAITQSILSGCPDTVPEVEGVQVIRRVEEEAREVAA